MKSFIHGFLVFSLIISSFMVDQAPAQAEAFFNSDPVDKPTIRVSNYTKDPGCTTCWNVQTTADPGDIISFIIYYHNTSGEAARNVVLRAAIPDQITQTQHITGSIIGQNAIESNGTATVFLSAGQRISLIHNSVRWYPNRSVTPVALPNNQSGNDIDDIGVGIGTIEPGWGTVGTLVFRAQVSNQQISGMITPGPITPTPTAPAQVPLVITDSATSIGQSFVTLNGRVFSQTGAEAWFEYGTSTSLGNTTSRQALGSGDRSFSATATGLQTNTTYFYRAVAQNQAGATRGSIVSFTTNPFPQDIFTPTPHPQSAPFVSTDSASSISDTFAVLRGSVNPNNSSTTAWFEYGTGFGLGNRVGDRSIGSGTSSIEFSQSISGLQPNTTYFYRAVAQNGFGTSFGSVRSFTTSGIIVTPFPTPFQQLPTVVTDPATSVGQTFATLNGRVFSSDGAEAWFEYGTTTSLGNTTSRQALVSTFNNSFSASVFGLFPSATYFYRAVARNNTGTQFGNIQSFTTQGAFTSTPAPSGIPGVITDAAASVSENFAVLRGRVNPNSTSTTVWFEYGTAPSFLGTRVGERSIGGGNTFVEFSQSVFGLQPNTTYFYRATARNAFGTSFGNILSFTTQGGSVVQPGRDVPLVFTDEATAIRAFSARLDASVNPRNSPTDAWFVYGTTPNFSFATPRDSVGSGNIFVNVSEAITGLRSNTTYYYRVIARNEVGTTFGNTRSFTTLRAPTGTTPPASPTPIPVNGADRPLMTLELSTDNENPNAGESFNVVVKYRNTGNNSARNATLVINLPPELEFERSTSTTQNVNNNLTTQLGTVSAGSESALVIRLKVQEDLVDDTDLIINATLSYQDAQNNLQSVGSFLTVRATGTGEDETAALGVLSLFQNWLSYLIFFLFLILALGIYAALARRIASLEERSTT